MGELDREDRHSTVVSRNEWLELIMDDYGERLTKLAFNYVKDWGIAQDVVQDVFVTCYNNYHEFRDAKSFKALIYRITINRCKDVLKSWSFKRVFLNPGVFQFLQSKELSPEMNTIQQDEDKTLTKSVLALPLKYREIIILYYYEGLAVSEISDLTGQNLNTIKTRLNRGRALMKKSFERSEGHGR